MYGKSISTCNHSRRSARVRLHATRIDHGLKTWMHEEPDVAAPHALYPCVIILLCSTASLRTKIAPDHSDMLSSIPADRLHEMELSMAERPRANEARCSAAMATID